MRRVATTALVRTYQPLCARALYTATPTQTPPSFPECTSGQVDAASFARSDGGNVFGGGSTASETASSWWSLEPFGLSSTRHSTAAVASRLSQQTQFPLLPGTPFTVNGAVTVNPLKQPRLVVTPGPESRVVFVNDEWVKLTGFNAHELKGTNGLDALTGTGTDGHTKEMIREALDRQKRVHGTVINFTKDKMPFVMHLQLSPLLSKDGMVSHILACVKHI